VAVALDHPRGGRLRDEQRAREQDQERHDRLEHAGGLMSSRIAPIRPPSRAGRAQHARAPPWPRSSSR
jgi:hypothetical protein